MESLERLRDWIGKQETVIDHITVPAMHRLAATLDRDSFFPSVGDPLPLGWHSILFPRVVRQSQVGADGHPVRGDFLPPVPLPRRMFAGRRVSFHDDFLIGDEARKVSTIKDVAIKEGRSGVMVFVTVRAEMLSPRGLAVMEEQDIVYRGEAPAGAAPPTAQHAPGEARWSRTVTPDEVMLFRYSALNFNGHRIHYDQPYATTTEGYPALIVNGGLTTLLLYELAREHAASPLVSMASRNVRPLYVNEPISLGGEPSADGRRAKLWAQDRSGALALSAEATFR